MPIAQSSSINQLIELNTESDDLDFENLRLFAIELVQKYSASIWTDYNLHDPGVTILEALCFALTDLAYRTNFPISDILTKQNGTIDYNDQSFYTIDQILATNPANLNDLKKVIVDQIDEIQYIDFKQYKSNTLITSNRGVYDTFIQLKQKTIEKIVILKDEIKEKNEYLSISKKIKECFYQYRYLGIDIDQVYFLKPKELNINAYIVISKDIDPEEILAKIYFEINNYFNHIIKFESAVDLYNKSVDLIEIFDGPILKKGIIHKNSFRPQIAEANENEILTLIKTIPGVIEILNFSISDINESKLSNVIRLKIDEYFIINHANVNNKIKLRTEDQEIKINNTFFENVYYEMINPGRIPNEKEIDEITNKKKYGRFRSLEIYHTIQNHFPNIYGLGLEGLAVSEGEERVANLKQLKAFLSIFEQIMANYLSQLNATNEIFSNKILDLDAKTYYSQSIHKITGLKEVLTFFNNVNYANGEIETEFNALNQLLSSLDKISESDTKFNDRKNAFFDHLLARFNISLNTAPVELYEQYYGSKSINRISNILMWKSKVLQNITSITSNRFKAPKYIQNSNEINFLSIIYNLLFIQNNPLSSLTKHFNENINKIGIINNSEIETITNEKLVLVDEVIPVIDNESLLKLKENNLGDDFMIFEFQNNQIFIDACHKKNFKIITDVFGTNDLLILFKSKNNSNWRVICRVQTEEIAITKIKLIIDYFLNLNKLSEGIHMIENIQLRPNDNYKMFEFYIIDNTTNKILIKSIDKKTKKENDAYIEELKNLILSLNDENYIEIINQLSNKYFINDTIDSIEKWYKILKDLVKVFNHDLSDYSIECYINYNDKNINLNFFDYKINFLIPNWPSRFQDIHFKKNIEEIITEYLPAHLIPNFIYLDFEQLSNFEKIYFEWISHYTEKDTKEFHDLSLSLTYFLNNL
jgi:hypothetical protein